MAANRPSLDTIFCAAIEIASEEERAAYVARNCGEDHELRARVEELLDAHARAGSFLELPASSAAAVTEEPITERPGTVIGPYKLLEQIGEGGFGIVFMAEQQQPVRRRVALKVLKPGMDTKQVVARFEAERQALALMDHTNIARVLDAGATDSGRPYFIMELVRGIPITQFCDDNRLTLRERLELFLAVCQAVQHAHQKGIIHRDLKPSNVLVTLHDGTPVVKVIDFGIAKALGQQRLTDKTLVTGFAQMIGTPLYMSPEQAEMSGLDADTRTDIYSLGVLLYELLTGTTPFEKERLKEANYDEIRRIIREEEPAKPSTRISTLGQAATTVSANRKSEPKRLSQLFRGELDWIVMKALEKDRNRRYDTVGNFAADVQRYLHDEPVQACPPSAWYRFRKFARRKKAVLMAASAIGLTVLLAMAGLAASTAQVWRANQELRQNLYYQHIALADREWSSNNLGRMEQLLDACPADLRGWEWRYLKRLPHNTLRPLYHESPVFRVAYSPTGRCFASSSLDGIIKVWNAQTPQLLHQISAHQGVLFGLAFSPDGQHLASAGGDSDIHVWDVQTGQRLHTWKQAHRGKVRSVAFSPEGRFLASGGAEESGGTSVKIWDAVDHQMLHELPGCSLELAFSPDGARLAGCGSEGIRVWNTRTGQELLAFRENSSTVQGVAFSPDGRYLAAAGADWVRRLDGEVWLWDARTGAECRTLTTAECRTMRGHTGFIVSIAFSPDGQRIASAGMDRTVKLWEVAGGRETLTLRGHRDFIRSVVFSPDSHKLLSASEDMQVRVWDATPLAEKPPQVPLTLRGHGAGVFGVAYHPDGRRLLTASADGTVKIWDGQTGNEERTFPAGPGSLWGLAISPDGRRIAASGASGAGYSRGQLRLWEANNGQELLPVLAFAGHAPRVAFSPNGRFLISVDWERKLRIWDSTTGLPIHEIPAHQYAIFGLAISPDGQYIASAAVDEKVKIWDVSTGRAVRTLEPDHRGRATSVEFRPDGRLLASASADGAIKLWDTRTWKQQGDDLRDPTGGVECLAFSLDNRLLAWGSTDGTVKLWDAVTKEIEILRGHTSWVEAVAFSLDGRQIASASLDGTVKIWKVPAVGKLSANRRQ